VGISGNTVVVGAKGVYRTGVGDDMGAAYVFAKLPTWYQQQNLTASDRAAGDRFGSAVAISGDTLVVGATNADVGAVADAGSAYVFTRSGYTWTEQAQLLPGVPTTNGHFGESVAVSGDTVVVGALRESAQGKQSSGAAYVFTRSGSVWTLQDRLFASDPGDFEAFGSSVGVSTDTVVVGEILDTAQTGSAHVFVKGLFELFIGEPPSLLTDPR
jgi:hypothetical protein